MTINALNFWLKVPNHSMDLIKSAVRMLHGSSLMSVRPLLPVNSQYSLTRPFRLDDIEDGSRLRRGKPSTHEIFGHAQTINSATYQYINATQEIRKLRNPHSIDIFIGK
jgi:ophiobolin F synthase